MPPPHRSPATDLLLPGLDLNLLKVFSAVYQLRQVTSAARMLDTTPSAVSNSLARLRNHCGDVLFVRTQRGVIPTTYADGLAAAVHEGLGIVRAGIARSEQAFSPSTSQRCFRVNLADVGQMLMIGNVVASLQKEAPFVGIRTTDVPVAEAEHALSRGEIDLAVGHIANMGKSLFRQKLVSETFVCVVGHGQRKSVRSLTLEDYLAATHIRYSPAAVSLSRLNAEVDRIFRKAGRTQNLALDAAHSFGLSAIVAQTSYILTVPKRLAEHYAKISPVTLIPLPFRLPPFDISLYWHERDHRDAAHSWFRGRFSETVRGS